jgi:hypothetical protein
MDWVRGTLAEGGFVSPRDLDLVHLTDDVEEAVAVMAQADAARPDRRRPPATGDEHPGDGALAPGTGPGGARDGAGD